MAELAGDGGIGETEDKDTISPVQSLLSVKATSNHNGSPESADGKQKTATLRQKLSPPRQTVQQKSSVDGTGGSVWYEHLWIIFYTFCIISGQYINFEILKILCSPKSSPTSSRKHSESSTKNGWHAYKCMQKWSGMHLQKCEKWLAYNVSCRLTAHVNISGTDNNSSPPQEHIV